MTTVTAFVPLSSVGRNAQSFDQLAEGNPCEGCPAPCCRMVLSPHPTPSSFSELDYIRYVLGFPDTEMVVSRDGSWQQLSHRTCRLLDLAGSLCTVHGTPRKPKVCSFFNPYRCWYKRNFTTPDPPDVVRLDLERFETVLASCQFDDGKLVAVPTWEQLRELVAPPLSTSG